MFASVSNAITHTRFIDELNNDIKQIKSSKSTDTQKHQDIMLHLIYKLTEQSSKCDEITKANLEHLAEMFYTYY